MVYRPRYLDPQRVRPIQILFEQRGNQLSIRYSDGSWASFSAEGIYGCDAKGNYREISPEWLGGRVPYERLLRSGFDAQSER